MQNIDMIQQSLDYIEENLKTEFSAEELANTVGYSLFHYYRIFQKIVGIPVIQYITRRKLLHAAFDIANGEKIIDVALSYGFETGAGFYKAFMREFHCSPSEYITRHSAKRPYRINLIQEEHIMLTHKKIKEMLSYWNMQNEKITDFYYAGTDERSDCEWNVGKTHVIKVGTNVVGLKNHIKISRTLADKGFGASLPVKTKDGDDYYWDGELYFCLQNKLNGSPLKSQSLYDANADFSPRYLGEIIGQLDLLLAKFSEDFVGNEPNVMESMKNWAIPAVRNLITLPASFYEQYLADFSVLYEQLPKQLIHRNPCPNNFVSYENNIIGVTDFELSEKNIRIFDPCYAATAILSENFNKSEEENEKWFTIFQDIIAGYDSVVKLSDAEKKTIPYVVFSIQFTCIAYFGQLDKYKELTTTNLAMLNWLIKHKEKLNIA